MGGNTSSSIFIFFFAFIASGTAGTAAYLRSGKPVTRLALITAGLNSGLLGLSICLIYLNKFRDNVHFLLGICVLSGLTGAAGLDFILTSIQNGGISINFKNKEVEFKDKKNDDTKEDRPNP
jgi:hypothetical protein